MLARFDENGNFTTIFKKQILEVSEDAKSAFSKIDNMKVADMPKNWIKWAESMGYADDNLKKFLTTSKEAYKTKDLATYTKYLNDHNKTLDLATLKTKAWAFAKNAALNIGFTLIMMGVSKVIDNMVNSQENAIEKADEFIGKFEEQRDALKSNKEAIDSMSADYEKLAKGVDSLGRNVSLNSDEYARYNEIVNKIADMFPQMVQGYTDEGNAIITHKGNVEELTKAYEEQKKAAQDAIIAGSAEVFKGFKAKVDKDALFRWDEAGLIQQRDVIEKLLNGFSSKVSNHDLHDSLGVEFQTLKQTFEGAGVDVKFYDAWTGSDLLENYLEDNITKLGAYLDTLRTQIETETAKIKPIMQAYLEQSYGYQVLDKDVQDIVKQIVGQFDSEFYAQFDNEVEMATWVTEHIVNKLKGEDGKNLAVELGAVFDLQTMFNDGEIPVAEYQKKLSNFINTIDLLPDEIQKNIKLMFGITYSSPMDGFTENSTVTYSDGQWWVNRVDGVGVYGGSIGIGNLVGRDSATVTYSDGQWWVNSFDKDGKYIESQSLSTQNMPGDTLLNNIKEKFGENYKNFEEEINKLDYNKLETLSNLDISPDGIKDWAEVETLIANANKEANKTTVSLDQMKKASEGISSLSKAFKELSDDGYITTDTILSIKEATGLSEEAWKSYEDKLLTVEKDSEEFQDILNDLTYKILENEFGVDGLKNATEEQIEAVLRENGVLNANAVAKKYKARSTLKAKIAELDYSDSVEDVISTLTEEINILGLTDTVVGELSSAYLLAQNAMSYALATQVADRLGLQKSELESITSVADAYSILADASSWTSSSGKKYNKDPAYYRSASQEDILEYQQDVEKIIALGEAREKINEIINSIDINTPTFTGSDSDKNKPDYEDPTEATINRINLRADELAQQEEEIQNLIEIAELEKDYEKQISLTNDKLDVQSQKVDALKTANDELHQMAEDLRNSTPQWNEEEWFDSQGNATEAYNSLYNSSSKEEQEKIKEQFETISKIKEAWVKNDEELVKLNKELLQDAETLNEVYSSQHENRIRDIEHERDMALETDPYADTTSYYKQLQDEYLKEAERLRKLDPEKYKEDIQKLQEAWWDAQSEIADWSLSYSERWINERNTYNDWEKYGDSEVKAWKRVLDRFRQEYPNELEKIKEIEENYFNARKAEFEKSTDFSTSYFDSKKTLLQSYYDVTNAIAEAQHEINKELETSKTMYEWLDEDTRKLLFNQEDYNILSEELYDIQYQADKLQREYNRALENSTLDTIEQITSNYEMQYETLMKSYEIAKADLEIAKKKAKLNNVLNERNVRMFIDGQWKWVANTEDVANAKSELADAEYAKKTAQAGAIQAESINALTLQQNELAVVINKFQSGVLDLDAAIGLAEKAVGRIPNMLSGGSSSVSSSSSSAFIDNEIASIKAQMAKNSLAWHSASKEEREALELENQRLGFLIDSDYDPISGSWTHKYVTGTNYTQPGKALMGEDGYEIFVNSNGHLIPINQPTIADIESGGIVFNTDQMKSLRTLWDMSNLNIRDNQSLLYRAQPQQIDQRQDNRIIINGMTVDSGSSDGRALINAFRRYVGNH